jgi:hypothetical protein
MKRITLLIFYAQDYFFSKVSPSTDYDFNDNSKKIQSTFGFLKSARDIFFSYKVRVSETIARFTALINSRQTGVGR